jgi:hypothetical protein
MWMITSDADDASTDGQAHPNSCDTCKQCRFKVTWMFTGSPTDTWQTFIKKQWAYGVHVGGGEIPFSLGCNADIGDDSYTENGTTSGTGDPTCVCED